ncbi:MAG: sulfatase activating formylglycine-generating enzyme [Chlamydiales bacterium]|jgi:formylglycine-generating enzyme required for sulfatase activity/tRNA A-37 threonylcarbamoyl transferase component Bud32
MIPPEHEHPEASTPDGAHDAALDSATFVKRLEGQRPAVEKHAPVSEIARGAMGIIQKVWDADLQRFLAKKVILSRKPAAAEDSHDEIDPLLLARFLEEAQISGQLEHPGIVPVHELGVDAEGRVYFTMQLVKGRELAEIFELAETDGENWSTTRALGVILKVCEATAYAHDKGVIHRDIKPANVMVGRFGEVYVMDWGLAHIVDATGKAKKSATSDTTMLTLDYARELVNDADGDSMRTMDGDVIGTPTFMSPQQARGRVADLDARADIYSVGALLYRLLSGQVPYVPQGEERTGLQVLRDLLEGPPTPILDLRPDVPRELVAICEKAMARSLTDRYRDMQELAEDLRAFLEGRVVQAFETGAIAELKKWVTRNKSLAAALLSMIFLVIGGLGAIVYVEARGRRAADAQRQIALENAAEAKANEVTANQNAEQARRERANVLRLSAFQQLEDLTAEAAALWPPLPDMVVGFEAWLSRAEGLAGGLHPDEDGHGGHYEQLEALRSRALPADPTVDHDHARYPELAAMRGEMEARTRARTVRRTGTLPEPFELPPESRRRTAEELNRLAWPLVDSQRTEFGRETEGLALARLALVRATSDLQRAEIGDSLAWALFACGRDDRALAASRATLELVTADDRPRFETYVAQLENAIDSESGEAGDLRIEALEDGVEDLGELIADERPLRFASDDDRWWRVQLAKLVAEIEAFSHEESGLIGGLAPGSGWGVERRLSFAREVQQRTVEGSEAQRAWQQAIASIRDIADCPEYRGLVIRPQMGLLPIGRDPESGLWEFGHVMSGEIPIRASDGFLGLDEDTCVVLVLVPGGTFTMGSQRDDPGASNYAASAEEREGPVHPVSLSPFLISKNELTQGQWSRIAGWNPSRYNPDTPPTNIGEITLANPVENVSWEECSLWLGRMGLELPTEAQWEYTARAGSSTEWWTGAERDSLVGAANLADRAATRAGATWSDIADWPELDDGWPVHGVVGSLAANHFGLHDVHGNVREWCRERRGTYGQPVAENNGERVDPEEQARIFRGGGFSNAAVRSRSGMRGAYPKDLRFNDLGVRPTRTLR